MGRAIACKGKRTSERSYQGNCLGRTIIDVCQSKRRCQRTPVPGTAQAGHDSGDEYNVEIRRPAGRQHDPEWLEARPRQTDPGNPAPRSRDPDQRAVPTEIRRRKDEPGGRQDTMTAAARFRCSGAESLMESKPAQPRNRQQVAAENHVPSPKKAVPFNGFSDFLS